VFGVNGSNGAISGSIISKMAADGHFGMTALSRVTLASAGLSCNIIYLYILRVYSSHSSVPVQPTAVSVITYHLHISRETAACRGTPFVTGQLYLPNCQVNRTSWDSDVCRVQSPQASPRDQSSGLQRALAVGHDAARPIYIFILLQMLILPMRRIKLYMYVVRPSVCMSRP